MGCSKPTSSRCIDKLGCPDQCPDFVIRCRDSKPDFRFDVSDCDGPIDLTGLVCEASMWAKAKLKKAITSDDTYFGLADQIGFEQAQVGDLIVMGRARGPEQMLVTGFDEANKLVRVQRGYNGSLRSTYAKGSAFKIFRVLNAVASTEIVKEDVSQVDGTIARNVLTKSTLIYEWQSADTCLPGCYWFEFKLLKMLAGNSMPPMAATPISFISYTPSQTGCDSGAGVQWVQRFPLHPEGFLVKIVESSTADNVVA